MPGITNPVDNNSSANIRPPSPTQEQVQQGSAIGTHPTDVLDDMDARSTKSGSPSRPSTPTLSEGLQTPRSNSGASTPVRKSTVSEELESADVDQSKTSSESTRSAKSSTENVQPEKDSSKPEKKSTFGFASRITSFFSNLGHKVQTGVEAAEKFLSAAKSTCIDIGKSIIESINKIITSLSPR